MGGSEVTQCRLMKSLHAMQRRGELCDFTLTAGTRAIPAHRCILASQSNLLKRQFLAEDHSGASSPSTLKMKSMSGDALPVFIEYVYTGTLGATELPLESIEEIIVAAQSLEFTILHTAVVGYFQRFLRWSQFGSVLELAERASMTELRDFLFTFATENLAEFMTKGHEEFCNLRLEEITEILSGPDAEGISPRIRVRAVVKWCINDSREQSECLNLLLGYVAIDQAKKNSLLAVIGSSWGEERPPSFHLDVVDQLFEGNGEVEFEADPLIYITGGEGENKTPTDDVLAFSPGRGSVVHRTNLPYKCLDHSAVTMDGKLFIAGGQTSNDSRIADSTDKFYSFDPARAKWTILPPMQKCRSVFSLISTDGTIYAVGGRNSMGSLASAECYNPSSNSWSYIPHTYTGIFGHAGASFDGMILISGGVVAGRHFTHSLQCYQPNIKKWTHMTPMPHKRAFHGMCKLGDKLYVTGGNTSDDSGRRVDCGIVEQYCPKHDQWRYLIFMPRPVSLAGATALDSKIFVIGGYSGKRGETFAEIQCYHTKRKQWSIVGNLPSKLMRLTAC